MNSQSLLNDPSNVESIKRICNQVLSDIAPEELILVDQVVDIFVEASDPNGNLKVVDSSYTDTPLGFGSNGELYTTIIVPIIINTLSKILGTFSDVSLKQAIDIIKDGRDKKDLKIEIVINEIRQEITIKASNSRVTKKKSKIIADKVLRIIANELSK